MLPTDGRSGARNTRLSGFSTHPVRRTATEYNVMKPMLRHWIVTCVSWSLSPAVVAVWLLVVLTKPGKKLLLSLVSVCLSIYFAVRLQVCLSVWQSACRSVCPFGSPLVSLSVRVAVRLFGSPLVNLFVCLPVRLQACQSVWQSACLSVRLPTSDPSP